jgi:gas vesicle protein
MTMETYNETVAGRSALVTFSAFVAGVAVGAAVALMLAPATGRDARAYLKQRGRELGREAFEQGRETLRAQSERLKSAATAGLDRASDAIRRASDEGQAAYREARAAHISS